MERPQGWRDGLALVGGIAIRPCSGTLPVLVLTWQLGIAVAGVAGALAMGIGTAMATVGATLLAGRARAAALGGPDDGRRARTLPLIDLLVGAAIALVVLEPLSGNLRPHGQRPSPL